MKEKGDNFGQEVKIVLGGGKRWVFSFLKEPQQQLLSCLRKQPSVILSCTKIKDNNPDTPTDSVFSLFSRNPQIRYCRHAAVFFVFLMS